MLYRKFNYLPDIVLYILYNFYINKCYGSLHLADNFNDETGISSFWLLQERNNSLLFQWSSFEPLEDSVLALALDSHEIEQQLSKRTSFGHLQTIGKTCESEKFRIQQLQYNLQFWILGLIDRTVETRRLSYTRVSRVSNIQIEKTNEKPTYITWEMTETMCSTHDKINIFKKDSTGFHRMYTVSISSRKFVFPEGLEDQEDIIIIINHENNFGLFELGEITENPFITAG
ncbi:hypothetical protein MN116_008601 [Schistosoma mekongi]|uniref:Uncharacterized protein n=1 Tax=Schistosoma mekongi TaxID=38744 RepID=A0AAE1Z4X6_SCHME|nr:hypothetical protein MN116_008601 [Schistosoma mekongi]